MATSCHLFPPFLNFSWLFSTLLTSARSSQLSSPHLFSFSHLLTFSQLFPPQSSHLFPPLPASSQLSSRLFSSDFTFTHCQNKLMTRRFSFKLLSTQPQYPRTLLQPHCDLQTELQNIIEHHRTTMATRIASLPRRQSTKSTNLRHFFTRNLQCLNGKMINTTKSWQP